MDYLLIKKDGVVSMDKSFEFICSQLRNGVYTLSIKRKTAPRTLSQNALMWLWYQCLEDATGQCKDDWHEYYKLKFLARSVYVNSREVKVAGSTSRLNTIQMSEYMNKIQADAAVEFGITLPLPSDKYYAEFIDYYKTR